VLEGVKVPGVLVETCGQCARPVSWPKQSAGRVFAASTRARQATKVHEFRVPPEAVDLALGVHAALGIVPKGDVFSLAIQLGLSVAGAADKPEAAWMLLETSGLEATCRARPVLSEETARRLHGLQVAWGCQSEAAVVRRLVSAAWLKFT